MQVLRFFFNPNGRITRLEFFVGTVLLATLIVFATVLFLKSDWLWREIYGSLLVLCGIAGISLQVKRFHDRNRSGWRLLVFFILFLPGIAVLISAAPSLLAVSVLGTTDATAVHIFGLLPLVCNTAFAQHLVEMFMLGSTKGPNRYGASKARGPGSEVEGDTPG